MSNAQVSSKAAKPERSSFPASRYVVYFALAGGGVAADLLTKSLVFAKLGSPPDLKYIDPSKAGSGEIWWLWEDYIGIQTAMNPGALFGMGAGMGFWFALLSIAAGIGVFYWLFIQGAASDLLLTTALGGVTGGILGNLYDRLGFAYQEGWPEYWKSAVRDWILFRYGEYTWPNFNIADSLLVCGAAMLVWHAYRYREPESDGQLASKSSSPAKAAR